MKEIIKKASISRQQNNQFITLNHLSPIRISKHMRELDEMGIDTVNRCFKEWENEIEAKRKLLEFDAVHIKDLTGRLFKRLSLSP
jgi:protein-tyrosine phosphatase